MHLDEWRLQRKRGHLRRLGPFVPLSVLLLWLVLLLATELSPEHKPLNLQPIEMRRLTAEQWMRNRSIKQQTQPQQVKVTRQEDEKKPQEEQLKEKEPEQQRPDGQIVDIVMPEKEEKPDDAKFVSQYDSKVKKETKARRTAPEENVTHKISNKGFEKPQEKFQQREDRLVVGAPQEQQDFMGGRKEKSLLIPDLKMTMKLDLDDSGQRSQFKNRKEEKRNLNGNAERLEMLFEENDNREGPGKSLMDSNIPKSLLPSFNDSQELARGAPMNDYLENVDEAEETWLNTKGFKYAVYYNRIKRKVAQNWHPVEAQMQYDPHFRIYGYQTRNTLLMITLDDKGYLEKADLMRSSGVDFLDRAAISAVSTAAPFPNPPPGIIENGKIKFPFRFVFELTRSNPLFNGAP